MKKDVSNLMKLITLATVLALVLPVTAIAQTGKVNFAGTWTMNAEKSTMPQGGGGPRMGGDITVTQEANLLSQTRIGQDGTARVTKYTLDGKESVNSMGGGESKSTAKWSADGKTLTIVTTFNFDGTDRTSSSVWSLVDAKTLSVVSTRQGPDGEVVTKLIYDKK